MKGWLIVFLVYLFGGIVTTIVLDVAAQKKGKTSPAIFVGGDPITILTWFFLWPIFAVISAMELSDPEEEIKEIKIEKFKVEIGALGISQTKMRPSGKVKINEEIIEGYSISGPIEAGEKVQVVSREMNHYKITRVEQDGGEECLTAPRRHPSPPRWKEK